MARGQRVDRGDRIASIDSYTVLSPQAGIVVELSAAPGGDVAAGPIATIADLDEVEVVADAPAGVADVAPGRVAEVEVDDELLATAIADVSAVADARGHVAVRARVANGSGALRAHAEARLRWRIAELVFAVPETAVVADGTTSVVFVRHGTSFARTAVIADWLAGRRVVRGPLHEGDEVVAMASALEESR